MNMPELFAKSLEGKFVKEYQRLYHITDSLNQRIFGYCVDPNNLERPIDGEFFQDSDYFDYDAEILTKEEFIVELDKALETIKTYILNDYSE